ncbi:nucleoside deaminase [candidate division KSB1 bacterium]|nr:nucleoside deaminase [candidate division KSB1 bacterium]
MKIALQEAHQAFEKGDYPVGALLTINGEEIAKTGNQVRSKNVWAAHAESALLIEQSERIRYEVINNKSEICLYTTLEPCLMCLGMSLIHRISRLIISCPDPHGGVIHINPEDLRPWYKDHWPDIKMGLFQNESYSLIVSWLKDRQNIVICKEMLLDFESMKRKWQEKQKIN